MYGLLTAIRFLHLAAVTLVLGTFTFCLLVARPAFREGGVHDLAVFERFERGLLRLAAWSLGIALVSALAWLWGQAVVAGGKSFVEGVSAETMGRVLTRTQFGKVWQLRAGFLLLLGAFLVFRERERDFRDWLGARVHAAMVGTGLIVALAWTGHAAATAGAGRPVHLLADAIHLVAGGVWLGGLPCLFLLLRQIRRAPEDRVPGMVAAEATRRFSALGLLAVGSLILTGVVNAWFLVGGVAPLVGTSYGRLLLLKVGLLLPLIGIAAVNRWRVKPALLAARDAAQGDASSALLRRLGRNVLAEASLGALILLVVGALGVTPPARHLQPSWPFSFRLSWEATRDTPGIQFWLIGGALFTAAGLVALVIGFRRRASPVLAVTLGVVLTLYGAGAALSRLAVDAYPTTFVRPAVAYQVLSISRGAHLYQRHCAVCHGSEGYGDGPSARTLSKKPADLTAKHTADHTAGDLFWWLGHGIGGTPMPGFEDRLTETERWDVINFVRALADAERARLLGPAVELEPWLVAPDFSFGIGVGPSETLKAHRGWAMVHLVFFTLPGSLPRLEQLDAAWSKIGLAGARVIAVPMRDTGQVYRQLGARAVNLPIAIDGAEEIIETYTLFRRTVATDRAPPVPLHMEFLIDRQGYIRARWIPGEAMGWEDIDRLLREIKRLDKEVPRAPAPEEHVH